MVTAESRAAAGTAANPERWLEPAARAGYVARGVVYLMVGGLAFLAATGGGDAEGSEGALARLIDQPGGQFLLGLIGLGLLAYSVWRFFAGAFDADDYGDDGKGLAMRGAAFVSCFVYAFLAVYTFRLIWGLARDGGGDENAQSASAWLMSQPFGQWLVGIVGACVIGAGFVQAGMAMKETFRRKMFIPPEHERWAVPVSKAGLLARGVVFVIIGAFLIVAAYQADPSETRGIQGALETLRQQAYGPWLLGITGLGLMAFAVHSFLQAKYRQIEVQSATGA